MGCESAPLLFTIAMLCVYRIGFYVPIAGLKGQAGRGFLRNRIAPLLVDNEREVLYVGDWERSGRSIEANARRVLEEAAGRDIIWTRVALTETQAAHLKPIWRVDGRDKVGDWAYEVEALGQRTIVALVRAALDARLPEPLERVHEREEAQRDELRKILEDLE